MWLLLLLAAAGATDGVAAGLDADSAGADGWTLPAPALLDIARRHNLGGCALTTIPKPPTCDEAGGCAGWTDLFAARAPFIIQHATDAWPASALWTREHLLRKHGAASLGQQVAGQAKLYESFGLNVQAGGGAGAGATLGEFIGAMRGGGNRSYLFDNSDDSVARRLLPEAGDFRALRELAQMDELTLSLAPSGVGFPLHTHGRSWIGLVAGQKLWAFYKPGQLPAEAEAMSVLHPLRWLESADGLSSIPPDRRPIFCLQKPGDLLFVPDYYYHWTLNLGEAVGFGAQRNDISASDAADLYGAWPGSGRASFKVAKHVAEGTLEPSGGDVARMLKAAALEEPWELPFSVQYAVTLLQQQGRGRGRARARKRGLKVLRDCGKRLLGLVKKKWASAQRVATPLAVLGVQLVQLGARTGLAKQLLRDAVAADGSLGFAWHHLALAEQASGALPEAVRAAEQAALLDGADGAAGALLAELRRA